MNENIIKIAVNGQVGNDTRVVYTWPDAFDPARFSARDEWLRSLYDPRDDVRGFSGNRFYALWKNAVGNYYSLIVPNAQDARAGWFMLTVYTGRCIVGDGHALLEVFGALEQALLSGRPVDNAYVAQMTSALTARLEADPGRPFANASRQKAFRTYANQQDVEQFLAWPNQSDYIAFLRILLVPSSGVALTPPQGFVPITSPIRRSFAVYTTQPGIEVNKTFVEDGEMLTVTYQRPTFLPETRQVVVNGQPGALLAYEGRRLRVLTPEEAGISFRRGVRLKCVEGQKVVSAFWVEMDGVQLTRHQGSDLFLLPSVQDSYRLTVRSHGYKPATILVQSNHLSGPVVKVTLQKAPAPKRPSDQKGTVRIFLAGVASVLVLAAAYVGVAFCWDIWPFDNKEPSFVDGKSEEGAGAEQIDYAAQEKLEKADQTYMKLNDEWNTDSIQSQRYKKLVDLLREGNIDKIAESPGWFPDDNVNGYWKAFEKMLADPSRLGQARKHTFVTYKDGKTIIELKALPKDDELRQSEQTEGGKSAPENFQGKSNPGTERTKAADSDKKSDAKKSDAKKSDAKKSDDKKSDTKKPAGREDSGED